MPSIELTLGLQGLKQLCRHLAAGLNAGDSVLLSGALGSGKTQFVKYLAEELSSSDEVTSPTYGLANFYQTERMPMLHIDTYRLDSLGEFRQLGLDEFFDSHLAVVEWADLVRGEFDNPVMVELSFPSGGAEEAGSGKRKVVISWSDAGRDQVGDLLELVAD